MMRSYAALATMLALLACGGSGNSGGTTQPPDTVAPTTTASPSGGTYTAIQHVRLSASEAATIFYTLDGSEPAPGQPGTLSGASPVTSIAIVEGTTVLRFRSRDAAGNIESTRSETYVITVPSPSVTLHAAPPPLGWLQTATATFESSESGTWTATLGPPGSGTVIASGTVNAGEQVAVPIEGWRLVFGAPSEFRVAVTAATGHTGAATMTVALKDIRSIAVGADPVTRIALAAERKKLYVAAGTSVGVIDADPLSPTFFTLLRSVPGFIRAFGLAVTPGGDRLLVTDDQAGKVAALDTATDSIVVGPSVLPGTPEEIAIHPGGARAYYLNFGGAIRFLDALSLADAGGISEPLLTNGAIAVAPNGARMLVSWMGMAARGADLVDTADGSPTFHQVLARPLPIVSGGVTPSAAITNDSTVGFTPVLDDSGTSFVLGKVDLTTGAVLARSTGWPGWGLAVTPDGAFVLNCHLAQVELLRASDLTLLATATLPSMGGSCVVAPGGDYAYVYGTHAIPLR